MAMSEYSSSLMEKYNGLMIQLEEEDSTHKKEKEQLQKKKEEAIRQHQVRLTNTHTAHCNRSCILPSDCGCNFQALLEKLDSVRVKLQLNNSKATKKNFLPKKQEMIREKNKAEEEKNR